MNKFRASYSILSTWFKGDYERAVKMYFKLETFTSPAMEWGKRLHEDWQKEIIATNCLPEVFGSIPMNKPETELKMVVQIHDWLELVGVVDCLDGSTIHEFKSGISKDSEAYASDWQVGVYGVLCTLNQKYVDRAEIHHWNQYSKKQDFSIAHLTDKRLKDTMNWIETYSSEMYNYLTVNDLYKRFA